MTTEDQDAEVGRLIRERRDLSAHREALLSKATKAGKMLAGIGRALFVQAPGGGKFPGVACTIEADGSVKVSDEYQPHNMLTGQYPTSAELHTLLADIHEVDQRLAQIATHLKPFGI